MRTFIDGYSDIIIETLDGSFRVIIEVKYAENGRFAPALDEVMKQIKDRNYSDILKSHSVGRIFRFAVACYIKRCQDNIRQTEQLSTEILKGLQSGESLAELFLKTVRVLSLCTNNKAEYDIIEDTLLTVYRSAFRDDDVMGLSAEKISRRLERLNEALKSVDN